MRYIVYRFLDGICNVYGHNVKYVNVLLVYYQHIENLTLVSGDRVASVKKTANWFMTTAGIILCNTDCIIEYCSHSRLGQGWKVIHEISVVRWPASFDRSSLFGHTRRSHSTHPSPAIFVRFKNIIMIFFKSPCNLYLWKETFISPS